jgi:hypothetical protein
MNLSITQHWEKKRNWVKSRQQHPTCALFQPLIQTQSSHCTDDKTRLKQWSQASARIDNVTGSNVHPPPTHISPSQMQAPGSLFWTFCHYFSDSITLCAPPRPSCFLRICIVRAGDTQWISQYRFSGYRPFSLCTDSTLTNLSTWSNLLATQSQHLYCFHNPSRTSTEQWKIWIS